MITGETKFGYRYWRVIDNELKSLNLYESVKPRELTSAKCLPISLYGNKNELYHTPHKSPDINCTCGYYVRNDINHALGYISAALINIKTGNFIFSLVEIGGTLCIHENGYRAEYIYPSILYYLKGTYSESIVKECANKYGVEAMPFSDEKLEILSLKDNINKLLINNHLIPPPYGYIKWK